MGYWVRFNADGVPNYHGSAPVDGAEWVEKTDAEICAMRRVGGAWVPREPEAVHEPTAEELAEIAADEYQAAMVARDAAIDAAVLASAAYRQFLRGEMTLTAYRDAASDIADGFPMPVAPS